MRRSRKRSSIRARPGARFMSSTSAPAPGSSSSPPRKRRACDVTAETCPHYLLLNRISTWLTLALLPSARRRFARAMRSPETPPRARRRPHRHHRLRSFPRAAGDENRREFLQGVGRHLGLPACVSALIRSCPRGKNRPFAAVARLTATNVARRFRLARKGRPRPGGRCRFGPAFHCNAERTIRLRRSALSPPAVALCGARARAWHVRETWARGETVSGKNQSPPRHPARILRPFPL